jgi:hypothetical protein
MNKEFWKATLIRAIRTICQTAIATIGTAVVLTDVKWEYVVSASLLAGLLSVLTSIATGLPEVDETEELTEEEALETMEEIPDVLDDLEGDEEDE